MSIATEISRLQQAKADIKTAIEGKGVTVPSDATLDDYADLVDSISGGGGGVDWENTFAKYLSNETIGTLQVPEDTTTINGYAFYSKPIDTIILPNTVTRVADYGFHSSKCTRVIYNSIPTFGTNAFQINTTITDIVNVLPVGLERTGNYMFRNCTGLVNVHIPQGVKILMVGMFFQATNIRSVTFPSSITNIYGDTFNGVNGIQELIFEGTTPPTLNHATAIGLTTWTFPIYVPDSAVETYKATTNWVGYASRIKGISERPTT